MAKFDCNSKEVESLVRHEVIYCATMAVEALLNTEEHLEDYYYLRQVEDYEQAFIDHDEDEKQEWLTEQALNTDCMDEDDFISACNDLNIDPHYHDVYEYWIVSNFLAARLKEHGEIVETDFHGLTIWGRTTTGQSITCDYVIAQIAEDIANEVAEIAG